MNKEQLQEKLGQETKYSKYYLLIIEKAKLENRKKYTKDNKNYVYYENHHILPRSLFPDYSNLKDNPWNGVLLTYREHILCHYLIYKHYKKYGTTKFESKMMYALNGMLCRNKNKMQYFKSRLYENIKMDVCHSEETKYKIKQARKLQASTVRTEESKKYMSEKMKGRVFTKEHCLNIKKSKESISTETKNKMSKSAVGNVSCYNIITNMYEDVNQEDFNNNINLIGVNIYNRIINIYFPNGNLFMSCIRNFKKVCEFYGFPIAAFRSSFKNSGKKIYVNNQSFINTKNKNEGNEEYIGWFTIDITDLSKIEINNLINKSIHLKED